jgi:Ca2+-dependent lipid-binding protein
VDTPDAYVKLNVRKAPNPKRQTKSCDNKNEPIWNETFKFFLKNVEGNNMGKHLRAVEIKKNNPRSILEI